MVAPITSGLSNLGASLELNEFLQGRYTTPYALLNTFNPDRLGAFGANAGPGIGADPAITGPIYVFVTKPDLNLGINNNPQDDGTANGGYNVAEAVLGIGQPVAPTALANLLTGGAGFIPLLTNLCKGYSAADVVMEMHAVGEAWDGAKQQIPKGTLQSRQDGQLVLEFEEWGGAPVLLLTKIWVDYIDAVTKGFLFPKVSANYVGKRTLDYACSIYAFQTLADRTTIEWGARWTGCVPTAVPHSGWSGQIPASHAAPGCSVPFTYQYYEPMDAAIFGEFNRVANPNLNLSGGLSDLPFIGSVIGALSGNSSAPNLVTSGVQISSTNPNLGPGSLAPNRSAYYLVFDPSTPVLNINGGF